MEEGRAYVACPQHNCPIIVDDEKTLSLVLKEDTKKKYRHLIMNSFIEANNAYYAYHAYVIVPMFWCKCRNVGSVTRFNMYLSAHSKK